MFFTTLVTEENADLFFPAISSMTLALCDVFLGVYDEETDAACGVLAAEALSGGLLSIEEIFVAERYRNQGAGSLLLNDVKELAKELGFFSLTCTYEKMEGDAQDVMTWLLTSAGFYKDENTMPVFRLKLSDINFPDSSDEEGVKQLLKLTDREWKDFARQSEKEEVPLWVRELYDERISCVLMDSFGQVEGALLFSKGTDIVNLSYVKIPETNEGLNRLMSKVYDVSKRHLSDDTWFRLQISNPAMIMMLNGISKQRLEKSGELVTTYFDLPMI